MIYCKSRQELDKMRTAGKIVAAVLEELARRAKAGVTTRELDSLAEKLVSDAGGRPAFKGYRGFPATICTSINEQIVHGIPSGRRLVEGDLLSLDMGVNYQGFFADSALTVGIGRIDEKLQLLLKVTEESLYFGIEKARVGNRVSDISAVIQKHVERHGFSVVRDFVGHGIGAALHEDPQIPNYGTPGRGQRLAAGMALAIEPMVNVGEPGVNWLEDKWTAVAADGSHSAHFEHTIAVTAEGPEILTALDVRAAADHSTGVPAGLRSAQ